MKGSELDNRRRLRSLSPQATRERQLAKWVREGKLEVTDGELRPKPDPQVTTVQVYKLPEERWD